MPFTQRDGARLHWRIDGAEGRPTLVLLNSIGTDIHLWDAVLPRLLGEFRLLRMDMRGHGASGAGEGEYTLDLLAGDVAAVMDDAGLAQASVVGVSLGGMVAMQLALDHPERVDRLVLVCTSAAMDAGTWADRIAAVRRGGTASIADFALGRFLSPRFLASHPEIADGLKRTLIEQSDDGYAGAAAAIRDMDLAGRLGSITQPALVLTAELDVATPYAGHGELLASAIPGARHASLPGAHLPPIEAPSQLAVAIADFLGDKGDVAAASDTLIEAGLRNRRRVLGDPWVDKALAGRTAFNADFQAMITRIAWHEIWGRPGLDDRTRRLLVIAITASLGRWEEFALHVRAGLSQGGFTSDELKETLMQTAIYAGVPAANTGFAEAARIMAELEGEHHG